MSRRLASPEAETMSYCDPPPCRMSVTISSDEPAYFAFTLQPVVDVAARDSGFAIPAVVVAHVDLRRADRDAPGISLEDVRDADEAGDELGLRMLVDVGRRSDLLDASFVEDREAVAHRERL